MYVRMSEETAKKVFNQFLIEIGSDYQVEEIGQTEFLLHNEKRKTAMFFDSKEGTVQYFDFDKEGDEYTPSHRLTISEFETINMLIEKTEI